MAKQEILKFRIFVGDRPLEDLSPQERAEFSRRTAERMGNALNDYFSCHPQEYIKWLESTSEGGACRCAT